MAQVIHFLLIFHLSWNRHLDQAIILTEVNVNIFDSWLSSPTNLSAYYLLFTITVGRGDSICVPTWTNSSSVIIHLGHQSACLFPPKPVVELTSCKGSGVFPLPGFITFPLNGELFRQQRLPKNFECLGLFNLHIQPIENILEIFTYTLMFLYLADTSVQLGTWQSLHATTLVA